MEKEQDHCCYVTPEFISVLRTGVLNLQAALVIRGFSIRDFDYSRTQKPRIARENCHF